MTTLDQKIYLINKYIEDELLDNNENKINVNWFDPYIYPIESYVPICTRCNMDYDNFKKSDIMEDNEVEMKHSKSCLWCDYFIKKMKTICPSSKIVRKKKKNQYLQ